MAFQQQDRYVQEDDPGAVGAFALWCVPTTGNISMRNTSNSGWTLIGNVNNPFLGLATQSGFTATGAITGVSGWAPLDSPALTTTATLNGVPLATQNDLTNLQTALVNLINAEVTQSINTFLSQATLSSNIAMGFGTFTFTQDVGPVVVQTIPLPFFGDGSQATQAQCIWMVTPLYQAFPNPGGNVTHFEYVDADGHGIADMSTTRTFAAQNIPQAGGGIIIPIFYLIIGRR